MTGTQPTAERPPRLLFAFALIGLAVLAAYAFDVLRGFVVDPLARGERTRSFVLVQLILLAMIPLGWTVLWFFLPQPYARLPRWAKLVGALLLPLPVCYFPVPALFLTTVDRMANRREIEVYRNASASLRSALEACRAAEGPYPENPEQCLRRGAGDVSPARRLRPEVKYYSDGRRYALGFAGSDPARDRSAVILFWSDSGQWSWHDYVSFATAVRGKPAREHLGFACIFFNEWTCRSPAS